MLQELITSFGLAAPMPDMDGEEPFLGCFGAMRTSDLCERA